MLSWISWRRSDGERCGLTLCGVGAERDNDFRRGSGYCNTRDRARWAASASGGFVERGAELMVYKTPDAEKLLGWNYRGLCKRPRIFADNLHREVKLMPGLYRLDWSLDYEEPDPLVQINLSVQHFECGRLLRPVETGRMKLSLPRLAARQGLGGRILELFTRFIAL